MDWDNSNFETYLQHLKDTVCTDDNINDGFKSAVNVIWAKYHYCKKYN